MMFTDGYLYVSVWMFNVISGLFFTQFSFSCFIQKTGIPTSTFSLNPSTPYVPLVICGKTSTQLLSEMSSVIKIIPLAPN